MSKLEVNAVEPQCGTNLTLGASGDTIIIPSGATISNQGTAAGFGPTGAVSWNTTKITADPNPAVSGVGYFADTTSAAFTITLPSSPSAGAVIGIADYANTFATNNLTVDRNGSNIGGSAINAVLSTNGVSVTLVYVDATQGWIITDSGARSDIPQPTFIVATGGTITCDGNFKIHTFTGPGTFTVCSVGNPLGSTELEYLVIAGGGGGSTGGTAGGGGGAGGFRFASPSISPLTYPAKPLAGSTLTAAVQGYPITVGAGGPAAASGNNSVFSTITSAGGGSGGTTGVGTNGGSGGGGGTTADTIYKNGGTGNTPPTSPSQGNNGGRGRHTPGVSQGSGGGGGALAAGEDGDLTPSGAGGVGGVGGGFPTAFGSTNGVPSGSFRYYAGGAGGGGNGVSGPAGLGGGGPGGTDVSGNGTPGTINSGGGGGGAMAPTGTGGTGGSGIVVIRYKFQ
jgi:hypothetical protein